MNNTLNGTRNKKTSVVATAKNKTSSLKKDVEVFKSKIQSLQEKVILLEEIVNFKKGDVVVWKKGLRNKTHPSDSEPGIIMELLSNPITTTGVESGSPYWNEPLDVIIASLDSDGDLVCFYYDKRRFKLVQ